MHLLFVAEATLPMLILNRSSLEDLFKKKYCF